MAVAFSMAWQQAAVKDWGGAAAPERAGAGAARMARLVAFRRELHGCFGRRADALSELTDAILCTEGPVRSPAELSVEPEFRRGHGSVY